MALVLDGTTGIVSANIADGTISASDLASGAITSAALPAGSVLQIVSATKTDTQSTTSQAWVDIVGLSVSITPRSTSSKIIVFINANGSGAYRYNALRVVRNGTAVGVGDADGSRSRVLAGFGQNEDATNSQYVLFNTSGSFVDTPATTSNLIYKAQFGNLNAAVTANINKILYTSDDDTWSMRGISTLTVMEIAG